MGTVCIFSSPKDCQGFDFVIYFTEKHPLLPLRDLNIIKTGKQTQQQQQKQNNNNSNNNNNKRND